MHGEVGEDLPTLGDEAEPLPCHARRRKTREPAPLELHRAVPCRQKAHEGPHRRVLPMPLRPMRQTTSPGPTSKLMSKRIWLRS